MNTQPSQDNAGPNVFGLFSGELAADPFPTLTQLRTMGSVVPAPMPFGSGQTWLVTQLQEAAYILKNHRLFTVDSRTVDPNGFSFFFQGAADDPDAASPFGNTMVSLDGLDHRRLRGLVAKVFTPRYMQGLRPSVQRLADELLDKAQSQGQMDLVRDFAYPLPINVISEMLGIPPEHRGQITRWSEALGKLGIMGPPDKEQRVQIRDFYTYVEDLIVLKRQKPGNDLITQLIQVEEQGDRLDTAELRAMVGILIFGGHETTSNFISMGMLMLLEHPTQLAQLKSDLSLIPTAVEELLRFNGPFTVIVPRFATQDLELGGQRIKRGDILIIMPPSINRDETQFAQADELQIARQLNNHLAFGQGVHVCLGAPLARLEGEIAFTTLLQRMPNLRLNAPRDSITWRVSGGLRGLNSLPVVF